MSGFRSGQRIAVTGGAGFLGTHVVRLVRERGGGEVFVPRRKDYDLTRIEDVRRLFDDARPDGNTGQMGLLFRQKPCKII